MLKKDDIGLLAKWQDLEILSLVKTMFDYRTSAGTTSYFNNTG